MADDLPTQRGFSLTRAQWAFFAFLVGPVVVLDVGLKIRRMARAGSWTGPVQLADQVRSELFAGVAMALLVLLVLGGPGARRIRVLIARLLIVVFGTVVLAVHVYFWITGSFLDADTIRSALTDWHDVDGVVAASVPQQYVVGLVLVLGCLWWLPTLVAGVLERDRHAMRRDPPRPLSAGEAAVGALLALVAIGLSAVPAHSTGTLFGRDVAVDLALSPFRKADLPEPDGYRPPMSDDLPTRTQLVGGTGDTPMNVVVVVLESVGLTATSLGDGSWDTTPFLKRWSKGTIQATQARAVVTHTSKSVTAIHCGTPPPFDNQHTEASAGGVYARCLPELLAGVGYDTAFMQTATQEFEDRPALVRELGYATFTPLERLDTAGYSKVNYFGVEDDALLPEVERWVTERAERPFMLGLLTVATHHDYVVPEGFAQRRYVDDEERNRYLNLVRYEDRFVEQLVAVLERTGHRDDTIVVVVGDHGEGFGQHGRWQHDNVIYDEGLRVPYLIFDPRRSSGTVIDEPVQTSSVLPTVVDLLGYTMAGGHYQAPSLFAPPEPSISSCLRVNSCVAIVDGTTKYIHHFGSQHDQAFDLAADPEERHDIADRIAPETKARLLDTISRWWWWNRDAYRITHEGETAP